MTPVTRRELLDGGLTLHGPTPAELLPPISRRWRVRRAIRARAFVRRGIKRVLAVG